MTGGGVLAAILSDQPDEVLADLKRQLERRIADARGALEQSENELRLVEQAIAARGHREPPESGGAPPGTDIERDREADGRFQGIPRATVLAVASTLPSPITPAQVVAAFAERGETVNIEQIRVALSRIAKDGDLTKVGPSLFAAPAGQLAEPDPLPETQPLDETSVAPDPFRRGVLGPFSRDAFRRSS